MRTVKNGDPVKAIRDVVDNSLLGKLLGFGPKPLVSDIDRIPQVDPNRSVYEVDPAGLPSTSDAFVRDFTPVGDIQTLIESASAAKDGNYAIAALGPLLMVLPQALGNKLKSNVTKLQRIRNSNIPLNQKQTEIMRVMGDVEALNLEALQFRANNPQAYDEAIREVAFDTDLIGKYDFSRMGSNDAVADAFISGRQRELGYRGVSPDPEGALTGSTSLMGGPPINVGDKRGLSMVEGTPSQRAARAALLHQKHGSSPNTGLMGSGEMQRMTGDTPLTRTPIPNKPYEVIRDGDKMMLTAGEIEEGDIIRSLSQKSQGMYGGDNRIVSTSAQDVSDNFAAFHHNVHEGGGPSADIFDDLKLKEPLGLDATQMEVDNYVDDLMQGMGLGSLADPNRPSFKIINTKGMPVTRADMMKPSNALMYKGEDEFGVSAKQAFDVWQTGLEQEGIPYMLLSPNRRYKYDRGGKLKVKKKRDPGVQVKKYYNGGSVTGPMLAKSDATYVDTPIPQIQSILQSLPDTRPTGPTIGPATPIDEDRYNREVRRRDAIARGVNPNLAFMMPPGLQGDPQAAAEYQQDNMLTSPIGQIATAMAFTPIDIGIEAALPFIPSTYAGRQFNKLSEYAGGQVQRGADALEGIGAGSSGSLGFATEQKIGEGYRKSKDVYDRRMKEYFSSEGQERMRNKIADDLTEMLNRGRSQKVIGGQGRQAIQRLEGAVINGRVNPNSPLVSQELQYANTQVRSSKFKPQAPSKPSGVGLSDSELIEMDYEYLNLIESGKKNAARYTDLIDEIENAERAGMWDVAQRKEKEFQVLEETMKREYDRKKNVASTMNQETGGLLKHDAFHSPGGNEIEVGGANLLDPANAARVTSHEFQHLLQRPGSLVIDPATGLSKSFLAQGKRNFGVSPESALKIEQDLGQLMKYSSPTGNLTDLRYFEHAGTRGNILERSAFVAELREAMVQKGAMSSSHDLVTPEMVGDFVKNQTEKGDLRIVDLFKFDKPEVSKIVSDAMNKLPVVAVGTGAAAATQEYKYGGKIKIKKSKTWKKMRSVS